MGRVGAVAYISDVSSFSAHTLRTLLEEALQREPTRGQQQFLSAFSDFLTDRERFRVFILKGYAGTGKTTLMSAVVQVLPRIGLTPVLLAPTGRAAKVLAGMTRRRAFTIHKKIYGRRSRNGFSYFELMHNPQKNAVFIIDEASMISYDSGMASASLFEQRRLLEDLLRYIYRGQNCVALFVGDGAQLPPVGLADSPALDKNFIEENYRLAVNTVELKDVVRQEADSGILYNATQLRKLLAAKKTNFPKLLTEGFEDVVRVNGAELQDELEQAFSQYGSEGVIFVTRSNKRANLFNQQVRQRIFWIENEINAADRLMVVKNNYYWLDDKSEAGFIANGDMLEVQKIRQVTERYGFRFAEAELRLTDYPDAPALECKLLLDTLSVEGPNLPAEDLKRLFDAVSEDYAEEPDNRKRREKVMDDPWYNALQVKFAWSVTCHKAQGGQWPAVFIDQGYLTEEMLDAEYLRWLYTAFTRATEKVFLVNFNPRFFADQ